MQKNPLNTKGFGLIGVLIIVAVLAVVGGSGAYVYSHDHKAKPTSAVSTVNSKSSTSGKTSTSTAAQTPADPYAGWTTASLKYEGLTFKYPSNWQLADASTPNGLTGTVSPGSDQATLTSPTGLTVSIKAGVTGVGDGPVGSDALTSSQSITTMGGSYYLDVAQGACVATSTTTSANWPYSKNIHLTNGTAKPFDVICVNPASTSTGSIQSDQSYSDAKLIIESLVY